MWSIFEPLNVYLPFLDMFCPITFSPKAIDEIKNIVANKNIPPAYSLRVGVKGGGCGGVSYMLGFDQQKPGDERVTFEELEVLIEKKHIMFLMGMHIDFLESADARGFTFVNQKLPERHDKVTE